MERNSYQFDKDLEHWELILCAVVNATIGLVSIIGNLMTLITFKIRPNLYTRRTVTLASVAIADFLVGIDCLVYALQFTLRQNWYYYTNNMEHLHLNLIGIAIYATQMFPTVTSGLHLILLTIERHASIVHPLKYRTKFTKKRAMVSIIIAWLVGFFAMYANFIVVSAAYAAGNTSLVLAGREYNSIYTVFVTVLIFTIITVDLLILYLVMVYKSWKQKAERTQITAASDNTRTNRNKAIMQIFFVLTFYSTFAWSPFIIALLYSQLSSSLAVYRSIFYSSFLGITNSCVNAFVYAVKNKDFREAFKCILKGDFRVKTNTQGLTSIYNVPQRSSFQEKTKTEPN